MDVVTGAAGFIGSHLTEELLKKGRDVVGIDNFSSYYSPEIKRSNVEKIRSTAENSNGNFELIEGSILRDEDLEKLPTDPERVFHEAAIAGVRYSIEHPVKYTKLNVLGTSKLLDYFEGMKKFVFAGSSSVYGEVPENQLPVKEDRKLNPQAPYPLSKKQAEDLIELFSDLYGIDYVTTRFFTVYGPRQRPDEAFTKFIKMILNGEPVTIYGDGEQSRDFTYVKDIVKGTILAAEKGDGNYNIGSGRRITVNDMVDTLDEVMEKEVERKCVEQPEGDVSHTHADISKARKELNYEPKVSFKEGTKNCVEWCREMRKRSLL
ncbi:MAG: GDP-mannose 4,6-dehydratase [Candidatus Aenigmatarchaeota archaeon]